MKFQYLLLALVVTLSLVLTYEGNKIRPELETQALVTVTDTTIRPSEAATLSEHITSVMALVGAKISPARKAALTQTLVSVVPKYIPDLKTQMDFIIVVAIESAFVDKRVSSTGARGLAQIMPKFAQNFADLCSIGKLDASDIDDNAVNLSLGACLFGKLSTQLGSSILALAAYNAGANSSSIKNLISFSSPTAETAGYIAKAMYIKEQLTKE